MNTNTQKGSSNSSEYIKVPHVQGLYRNTRTGRYYGVKKVKGKRKERSLDTTDRRIAEARLREWFLSLEKVDQEVEKTSLSKLSASLLAITKGKSDSSVGIVTSILADLKLFFQQKGLGDPQVRNIRPSMLEEWLANEEIRLRNTSYNRYAGVVKQLFELAVKDRIIAESPFDKVRTRWKPPQTPKRLVPTLEQFEAIIAEVRREKRSHFHRETGDFLEFIGLAGVGQAEASSLTWGDVDFAKGTLSFRRHKTDRRFTVPIYPDLRPLLERLYQEAGKAVKPRDCVLKIQDGRKALTNACSRLGLPHFSQRNLRQCLIKRLWRAGVDKKFISKWQGHQDGGKLIMDTYTEVFGSDDEEYEALQLAKLISPALKQEVKQAA
jgi:integrase